MAPEIEALPVDDTWVPRWSNSAAQYADVTALPGWRDPTRLATRWANHPRSPSLHTRDVPRDWSTARAARLELWSEQATNERVTFALLSDHAQTPERDWLLATFVVDWRGPRTLQIPLDRLERLGTPTGLHQVDGAFLFTRIFDRTPHPDTVLAIERLEPDARLDATARAAVVPTLPPASRLHTTAAPFDGTWLNHDALELRHAFPSVMFQAEAYFRAERARLGWFPRFAPGFPSVAPDGSTFLRTHGNVEYLQADGRWQLVDLWGGVVLPWADRAMGARALSLHDAGTSDDVSIAFDGEGGAYVLEPVAPFPDDGRQRRLVLLYSPDRMRTWQVHELPAPFGRFEKPAGAGGQRHPPAILLSSGVAPTHISLVVPEKDARGSLVLPPPVTLADDGIALMPHSGEAAQAVSVGDAVFVAYGRLAVVPGYREHDGAPAFVVRWDRRQRRLSAPVLVGFGGGTARDDHNWPAIAADSQGYLHVIVNGHHDPVLYRRSERPGDIEHWLPAESFGDGTSYGGLVIDGADNLYVVTRAADVGYEFRLALHRRRAGATSWEPARYLTSPHKPYYQVYFHKLTIDRATNRLYLAYWGQSATMCFFQDDLAAAAFIWPDREASFRAQAGTRLTLHNASPPVYGYADAPPSELTLLLSDDGGDVWRLATTPDFHPLAPTWRPRQPRGTTLVGAR